MNEPRKFIKTPCHEDWNLMSGDEKVRHCKKCDTHVHDLTGMTEEEITALYRKKGGKLCGRFSLVPGLAKPLAVGTGIASLALAACQSQSVSDNGNTDSVDAGNASRNEAQPFPKTPKEEIGEGQSSEPPAVLGIVCLPTDSPPRGGN